MSIYDDPYAVIILLAEITYYDVAGAVERTFYAASTDFTTEPTDTPANTYYAGAIQDDVFFERSMYAGDRIGGASIPDFGSLTLINAQDPDGNTLLDEWFDPDAVAVEGRSIRLYVHDQRNAFSSRVLVMEGKSASMEVAEDTITLVFRSKAAALEKSMVQSRYAGTGGDEGPADLTGAPKPLLFGKCANVPLLLLDSSTLRGQVHGGAVQNFDAVRDKGVLLTITTDYSEDKPNGIVDLVANPDGEVTVDVQGSTLGGTYSAKVGGIMSYIAGTLAGLSVSAASITALNTAAPQTVGLFLPDDVTRFEALDALSAALGDPGVTHGINRDGEFVASLFAAPSGSAVIELAEEDIEDASLSRSQVGAVASKVTLRGRRNWLRQSKDGMAASVTDTDKEKYAREYQDTAIAEDSSVLTKYPDATTMQFDTLMQDSAELSARASALLTWWKSPRYLYSITTMNLQPLQLDIGDVVQVTHPRFGLADGKLLRVVRLREYYLERRVELAGVA